MGDVRTISSPWIDCVSGQRDMASVSSLPYSISAPHPLIDKGWRGNLSSVVSRWVRREGGKGHDRCLQGREGRRAGRDLQSGFQLYGVRVTIESRRLGHNKVTSECGEEGLAQTGMGFAVVSGTSDHDIYVSTRGFPPVQVIASAGITTAEAGIHRCTCDSFP